MNSKSASRTPVSNVPSPASGRRFEPLLRVDGLKTYFQIGEGLAKAVDGVRFTLETGQTLGLVGESGCGKSVTAMSIMRLIPRPPGRIVGGRVLFNQQGDLLRLNEAEMRSIRGNDISMIFQEPMTSLNPVFKISRQIGEAVMLHQHVSPREALKRSIEMLGLVGIPSPEKRVHDYPHQMSGGMRQRVMIAMAMACHPKLLLADEPTTALDVTIQAQILDLMNRLKEDTGTSIIMITHDLGVIAEMAEKISVMYAGVVVESADVRTLFKNPLHPYTQGLLTSIPRHGRTRRKGQRLNTIPGLVPSLLNLPAGCRFAQRCRQAMELCLIEEPRLLPPNDGPTDGQTVRCWLHQDDRTGESE